MLRLSSTTLIAATLVGLSSTGCAAKLQAHAGASWTGQATTPHIASSTQPAPTQPAPDQPGCAPAKQPEIYGVPLAGAQDVVFVIDCSGSMSGDATAGTLPSTPFAAIAAVGILAASAAESTVGRAPAAPSLLSFPPSLPSLGAISLQPPREDKLQAAKAELLGVLGTLPDNTRFNVVYFNDGARGWATGLLPMHAIHRFGAISFVHGIPSSGSTAAVPALRLAYQSRPARVVFLSDGIANTGGDRNVVLHEARREMRRGVRFDTVGLGADQDADLLASMARESGGVMVAR